MTIKEYEKWCKKYKKKVKKRCKECKKRKNGMYGVLCEHCINDLQHEINEMKKKVIL